MIAEELAEKLLDFLRLVLPHEAVVNKHAGELVGDGADEQRGDDRGIHAAGEAAQHAAGADLRAEGRHRLGDEILRLPTGDAAADLAEEIAQHRRPADGVAHLGVELHAVEAPRGVAHGRDRRVVAGGQDLKAGRDLLDAVAVAHPRLAGGVDARQQRAGLGDLNLGEAILAPLAGMDLAAQQMGHELVPVADPEDRNPGLQNARVQRGGAGLVDGGRAAAQNQAAGAVGEELLHGDRGGTRFRAHALLLHLTHDKLQVLRAEIKNKDALSRAGLVGASHGHSRGM